MRISQIEILGAIRPMCFSARVATAVEEKYGGMEKLMDALTGEQYMSSNIWLLGKMLDAGARATKMEGNSCPPAPSEDELLDGCDLSDMRGLTAKLFAAMMASKEQHVELEQGKNGVATPAAE